MPTQAREYKFERRVRATKKTTTYYGNCVMCARSGVLGAVCTAGCREGDDLANNETGLAEANEQVIGVGARCRYSVAMMPDCRTTIRAEWYEKAIVDNDVSDAGYPYGKALKQGQP